ncbi:hypothetical protein [Streptomyces sp. NPDC002328]|uniref:hypothetical protein n=1 Tax=Streptomyces sp. NPDC002328 TaxID=3364642 RepID=UPI0036D0587C
MTDVTQVRAGWREVCDRVKWTFLVILMFGLLACLLVSFLAFLFVWFVPFLLLMGGSIDH